MTDTPNELLNVTPSFAETLAQKAGFTLSDIDDAYCVGKIERGHGTLPKNAKYHQLCPKELRPEWVGHCYCGQPIKVNYHVYSEKANVVLAIGSECVKHFSATGRKRVCVECYVPHRANTELCTRCRSVADWMPIWKAKDALGALNYKTKEAGLSSSGNKKVKVLFTLGISRVISCLGVELVSKAGNPYISVRILQQDIFNAKH